MRAEIVYKALENQFKPWECTDVFPTIGLQHHYADEIDTVYTATFADDEVFQKLIELNAKDCMLFTHHPVPQREDILKPPMPIKKEWQELMEKNRINLFSYHIPLDKNGPYSPGNNLAKAMGIVPYGEFYEQNGVKMGVLCNTPYLTVYDAQKALEKALCHKTKLYLQGEEQLYKGRVAIMAGGAKSLDIYEYLEKEGVRLFITGVTSEQASWVEEVHERAKNSKVSILGGTHCSTEKFAPMAMTEFFKALGLKSYFIEETPKFNEL